MESTRRRPIALKDVLSYDARRRFHERTMPEPANFGCVMWLGRTTRRGYGVFCVSEGAHGAHRVAWIIHHKALIPDGLVIDHLCRYPACVNPDHLEAVTPEENARRVGIAPPGWIAISPNTIRRRRIEDLAS